MATPRDIDNIWVEEIFAKSESVSKINLTH